MDIREEDRRFKLASLDRKLGVPSVIKQAIDRQLRSGQEVF